MNHNKDDELIIGAGAVRGGAREYFMNGIRRKNGRRTEHYKGVDTGFSCGLGGCQEVEPFAAASSANMRASVAPVGTMPSESGVVRRSPMQASGNLAADLQLMSRTNPVESQKLAAKSDMYADTDLLGIVDQKVYQGGKIAASRENQMDPYRRRERFTGQKMRIEDEEPYRVRERMGHVNMEDEEPYRRRVAGQQRVPVRRVERFAQQGSLTQHSKEVEHFNRKMQPVARACVRKNVMHEQYMKKVVPTKSKGLRAQYGL